MGYNPRTVWYQAKYTGEHDTRVKQQPLGAKVDVKAGGTVVVDGDMAEHLRTQQYWEVANQPCEAPKWYKEPEQTKETQTKSKSEERREAVQKEENTDEAKAKKSSK